MAPGLISGVVQPMLPEQTSLEPATAAPRRPLDSRQQAVMRLRVGKRFSARAEVDVTPALFLTIGAMVGAILLGSAAIVHAARR